MIVSTHQPKNSLVPVVAQRLRKVTGTAEMFADLPEEANILMPDLVERKLECYPHDTEVG